MKEIISAWNKLEIIPGDDFFEIAVPDKISLNIVRDRFFARVIAKNGEVALEKSIASLIDHELGKSIFIKAEFFADFSEIHIYWVNEKSQKVINKYRVRHEH